MGGVGAGDHGFGRNTSGVDAGAAEEIALDDGDALAGSGEAGGKGGSGLSGTDDDGVEIFSESHRAQCYN